MYCKIIAQSKSYTLTNLTEALKNFHENISNSEKATHLLKEIQTLFQNLNIEKTEDFYEVFTHIQIIQNLTKENTFTASDTPLYPQYKAAFINKKWPSIPGEEPGITQRIILLHQTNTPQEFQERTSKKSLSKISRKLTQSIEKLSRLKQSPPTASQLKKIQSLEKEIEKLSNKWLRAINQFLSPTQEESALFQTSLFRLNQTIQAKITIDKEDYSINAEKIFVPPKTNKSEYKSHVRNMARELLLSDSPFNLFTQEDAVGLTTNTLTTDRKKQLAKSENELNPWIALQILGQKNLAEQKRYLAFFMDVMEHLHEIRAYTSAGTILSALNTMYIEKTPIPTQEQRDRQSQLLSFYTKDGTAHLLENQKHLCIPLLLSYFSFAERGSQGGSSLEPLSNIMKTIMTFKNHIKRSIPESTSEHPLRLDDQPIETTVETVLWELKNRSKGASVGQDSACDVEELERHATQAKKVDLPTLEIISSAEDKIGPARSARPSIILVKQGSRHSILNNLITITETEV